MVLECVVSKELQSDGDISWVMMEGGDVSLSVVHEILDLGQFLSVSVLRYTFCMFSLKIHFRIVLVLRYVLEVSSGCVS